MISNDYLISALILVMNGWSAAAGHGTYLLRKEQRTFNLVPLYNVKAGQCRHSTKVLGHSSSTIAL